MALTDRTQPFLYALAPPLRDDLLRLGAERSFAPGEHLMRESEPGRTVVVLLDGWSAVSISTGRSSYRLLLALRGPGELVGEMAMADGSPRSATVTALGTVRAVVVGIDSFRRFVAVNPQAGGLVMAQLAARLRGADEERRSLVSLTVLQRLAARLLEFAALPLPDGRGRETGDMLPVDLAQHDLADAVGATREAVAKALRPLRDAGAVRTRPRRVEILDRTVLEVLAAGASLDS
ncbi:Crp/Fnr family transcriptional regulator [Streptomyces sp. NPDC005811]|uniref:Crp/Fnr family transcriptional regulator n=1 Tax=Streptomyces sp. NPDC005811 TaxID=3154565 RepID=UPI0033DB0AF4